MTKLQYLDGPIIWDRKRGSKGGTTPGKTRINSLGRKLFSKRVVYIKNTQSTSYREGPGDLVYIRFKGNHSIKNND